MAGKKKETVSYSKKDTVMILGIVVACAVLAIVLMIIGQNVRNKDTKQPTKESIWEERGWHDFSSYFSKGLNEDGTIAGVNAADVVELCDYHDIMIPDGEQPKTYVSNYLLENCKVQDQETLREIIEERMRFYANYMYEYNEKNYYEYHEKHQFENIYEAYQTTEEGYEQYMKEESVKQMRLWLILQAIHEKEQLSFERADVLDWILKEGFDPKDEEGIVFQHGEPYTKLMGRQQAVWNLLLETKE